MKTNHIVAALVGTAFLAGIIAAVFTLLPSLSSLNNGLSCITEDCSDLAAQRSMALAAWAMVALSGLGAVVGGLSLALIFFTLDAARRSAKAAEETALSAVQSARIGEDALEVTRRMAVAQTRCYVTVASVATQFTLNTIFLYVTLRNSGSTPARSVSARISIRVPLIDEAFREEKVFVADIAGQDKEVIFFEVQAFSARWADALVHNNASLSVTGDIAYVDIFGMRHEYRFSFAGKKDLRTATGRSELSRKPAAETDLEGWV